MVHKILLSSMGQVQSPLVLALKEIVLKYTLGFEEDHSNADSSPNLRKGLHCAASAGLKHLGSSTPHSIVSPLDEITDVHHHTHSASESDIPE